MLKKIVLYITASACVLLAAAESAPAQTTARLDAERLFVMAQRALSQGDDGRAESLLMQALQKDGSFTSAIWQLAQIYEKRGRLEYARELLIRGLKQDPRASWARDRLSQLETALYRKLIAEADGLMSRERFDLAIPKLSICIGIKHRDALPYIYMGRCHLSLGNLDTSREYFEQALEREPSSSRITSLLDEVNERIRVKSFQALVNNARRILSVYSPEKRDEAKAALEAVTRVDPENEWAKEKLKELDLLKVETESEPSMEHAAEKRPGSMEKMLSASSWFMRLLVKNISSILLGIVAILLAVSIKRRMESRSYPLQGSLILVPILDIVSLINGNLKSGRLVITSNRDKGEIYFEKGEIIQARWKGSDGKKAFHKLMSLRSGSYHFVNHLPNVRHKIDEPLSLLLLSMRSARDSTARPNKSEYERETVGSQSR